jgi:hypothetical protein
MQQTPAVTFTAKLRSKTMNHLTVVIIALLIPATAMATGECKQDRLKFCKHAPHVAACLDKHKAQLSEACKAKQARAKAKKNTEESAKRGKEEGATAQSGAQPLTKEGCKTAGMKWNYQSNVCG